MGMTSPEASGIIEIAEIDVAEGAEEAFEAGVAEAIPLFRASAGCLSLELVRSVEFPQRYRLMVGWTSVEAHVVDFRESDAFQEWRRLVSPHFASAPRVEHVRTAIDGFNVHPAKED